MLFTGYHLVENMQNLSKIFITTFWSLRPFLYSSSVYSCHILISSASVRSLPYHFYLLFCPSLHEISPDISNFLDKISSLSHSVTFLCFFALLIGLLISCYSLELCIQLGISIPFSIAFCFFLLLFVKPPRPLCLLAFLFLWDGFGYCLLYNIISLHL